jgi:hypothetical protein
MQSIRLSSCVAAALALATIPVHADDSRERIGMEPIAQALPDPARQQPDPAARARAVAQLRGSDGLLLVPDSTADRVIALDPLTGDVVDENFIPVDTTNLATPVNAILSADGTRIFVSDQINDVVQAYAVADGSYIGVHAPAGGANTAILDNIRGIALRTNGHLLVSNSSSGGIVEFDTEGELVGDFIANGVGGIDDPFEIVEVTREAKPLVDGDFLVSDIQIEAVLRYDSSGAPLPPVVSTGINFPQQITQAANGNVLVATFSPPSAIHEFEPDGTPVGAYTAGLSGFRGVHELPNGNLLATTGTGIHEIGRDNQLVRTIVADVSARFIERVGGSGGADDVIFADGFELPPQLVCGWDTTLGTPGGSVGSIGVWNDELYVGASGAGSFGGVPGGVQRVDIASGTVSPLGTTTLVDGFVTDFVPYDDGDGERLFIAGAFNGISFDGSELPDSRGLVAWDGTVTTTIPNQPFAQPLSFAQTATVWNGRLVVGGSRGAAEPPQKPLLGLWDGTDWSEFHDEFEGTVAPVLLASAVYDGDLYIGGRFARIRLPDGGGGQVVTESVNVMGFDGSAFFSVGGGVNRSSSPVSQVLALKAFDNGDGEALYIGGRFDQSVGGTPLFAVAKWDGTTLSAVGAGFPMPSEVRAFEVHDDGAGPALYAVGTFTADTLGVPMRRFAKLVGDDWVEVAGGVGENPNRARALPDGSLAVAGSFTEVGAVGAVPGSGLSSGIAVLECGVPE